MTEDMARKKIVGVCRHIMTEWEEGRDWRWPTAGRDGTEQLARIPLDTKWPDYRSLGSSWWFAHKVSEAITEGLSGLDNLSWDEALMTLEETTRRLETKKAIEDPVVLSYLPKSAASGCNPFAALAKLFRGG